MIGRAAIADAWFGRSARERAVLAVLAAIVVAAIVVFAVLRPLAGAVERARADAARAEALLAAARADRAMEDSLARAVPATGAGNSAIAVTRALAQHGLTPLAPPRAGDDGSVDVIVAAVPFDALVRALDALARSDGLHVEHAVLARLADADGVRAELSLRAGAPH
ncbi:MAG TPA: type II secretion system protein GspM [Casimicrobiaceae bacterium]